MGALKGQVTYTRYYLREVVDIDPQKILRTARTRMFTDLTTDEEVSVGWVQSSEPFGESQSLRKEEVFVGDYVFLTMRHDKWNIQGNVLRAHVKEETARFKEKYGHRPNGEQRAEIREVVIKRLRESGMPTSKLVEVVWDLEQRVVLIFTKSQAMLAHVVELLERSAGIELWPDSPATFVIWRAASGDGKHAAWSAATSAAPFSIHRFDGALARPESRQRGLAEIVETQRFLGHEFLTWLWFKSMEPSTEHLPAGITLAEPGGKFVLVSTPECHEAGRVSVVAAAPGQTKEAMEALRAGKWLAEASLLIHEEVEVQRGDEKAVDDRPYSLTFDATQFTVSGLKLPAVLTDKDDEPLVERMSLIRTVQSVIDVLYTTFLRQRSTDSFNEQIKAMRRWVKEGV